MEPSLEEGVVTIPSSSRTLAQKIVDVLAFVPKIVSEYFDVCDNHYSNEWKEKGILWRIFFSPLTRKNAFIISWIAVSIDPLFFYIPVIDEKNKCLGIDKTLKTAALCLRALPDAAFALRTINNVFTVFKELDGFKRLLASFIAILIGAFLILPIPQVKELQHMNDCALGTICDYLKPKTFEEKAMVVEGGQRLNSMLIIISGSMQAYLPIRDAGEAAPSNSFDTLETGMFVGEHLLYWAMKTKAFDDQPASFNTIQCTKKVEAFALTVDDLKTLALSGDIFPMKFKVRLIKIADEPKIREKLEVIFLWMAINGISDDVALDIIRGICQHKLEENIDAEVDVNYIFSVLDEHGKSIMRRHFCRETLKKVKELQNMNDQALGTICDYLKPKMFEENAQVVEAGHLLNTMLIIISGSMQAYLGVRDAGDATPSTSFEFEILEKGMFVGEQLLDWAAKTKTFDDQPVSFKTVRCYKKVEAFALTVDDLTTLVLSIDIFPMKSKVGILKIAADPKIREKLEAIFLWMAINGISDDVAIDIMYGFSQNKLEEKIDAEVDVNYIFSVFDERGRSIMQRHFCMENLKKEEENKRKGH